MNTRQCYWCRRTVDRRVYFCSEKCRYEYNTAKGTDQTMYDVDSWIRIENQNAKENVVLWVFILGFIDFWLYLLSRTYLPPLFNIEHSYDLFNWKSLSTIIPVLAVVVTDLLLIRLFTNKGVLKWLRKSGINV